MNSLIRTLALSLSVAALAVSAQAANVSISGSTTVASAIVMPMETAIEANAGVELDVVANGSSRGIADLVAGRSSIAMISAPLDVTVTKVNKKNPGLLDGVNLVGHEVGETVVAFTVHASNPVTALTLDQVTGILSGAIVNWSALGGPDMPIVVVAETSGGGVRSLVEDRLLDGASISAQLREFPNATQVPSVSQQLPPAFGISGHDASVAAGATVIETDTAISQPLILVTVGQPEPDTARVIEAVRNAGS